METFEDIENICDAEKFHGNISQALLCQTQIAVAGH